MCSSSVVRGNQIRDSDEYVENTLNSVSNCTKSINQSYPYLFIDLFIILFVYKYYINKLNMINL